MSYEKEKLVGLLYETQTNDCFSASQARSQLYRLIDEAAESYEPITITGKRSNAVMLAEEDWKAIEETLYLLSITGMRKSIQKGLKIPIEECAKDVRW